MAYDFDTIAARYDRMNRVMTWGLDRRWRRKAALAACNSEAVLSEGCDALDVACGTGDMATALAESPNRFHVRGCDISEEMIAIAKQKSPALFELADVERLPYPDSSFSAVTCAFGVRNFVHLEAGLKEMLRVLTPGGRLVILELATPDSALVRPFYNLYTRRIIPWLGARMAGNREAYTYLQKSIERFPKGQQFKEILDRLGAHTTERKLCFGVCRLYCAEKK